MSWVNRVDLPVDDCGDLSRSRDGVCVVVAHCSFSLC
jgi:hypothetical protein